MESPKAVSTIPEETEDTGKARSPKRRRVAERSTQSLTRFEREIIRIFERTRFDEATASCSPKDERELEEIVDKYAESW